jgi:DNA-binding transcriptional LysR family regulator
MRTVDWDDLRVFLEVARTCSLSEAARRLRLDHSTVSRRIAQLEFTLGVGLLERNRSGIKLNEHGEALMRHTETMEGAAISAEEFLRGGERPISGPVRIASMEGIGSLFLAPRLRLLVLKYPGIKPELITSPQPVHVNRREADIFISFFQPTGRGLVSEKAGDFHLSLYGSPEYFERRLMPLTVADLGGHAFCTYLDDLVQLETVRWLDEVIGEPEVAFASNSMIAQMGAAKAGMGLVMLPKFAMPYADGMIPVLADKITVTRDIWISVNSDLQFAPRMKAVVSFLKDLFLKQRDHFI